MPKKFRSRKERKEIFEATCNTCPKRKARQLYEQGVKRGIWLKNWQRAIDAFRKACQEYTNIGDRETALTVELMGLMCTLKSNTDRDTAQNVINRLISGTYNDFLNVNFVIPEFGDLDPIYEEAVAWSSYFQVNLEKNIENRPKIMKEAAYKFSGMGYKPLLFSKHILQRSLTSIFLTLELEATAEEVLGRYYLENGDLNKASIHLQGAIIVYTNMERPQKSRELKKIRQSLRMERACWICGTRNKGYGKTFFYIFARLKTSHFKRIQDLVIQRQRWNPAMHYDTVYSTDAPLSVIEQSDRTTEGVYLCVCDACKGILDEMSQRIVTEAVKPLWQKIGTLESQISLLQNQIAQLRQELGKAVYT